MLFDHSITCWPIHGFYHFDCAVATVDPVLTKAFPNVSLAGSGLGGLARLRYDLDGRKRTSSCAYRAFIALAFDILGNSRYQRASKCVVFRTTSYFLRYSLCNDSRSLTKSMRYKRLYRNNRKSLLGHHHHFQTNTAIGARRIWADSRPSASRLRSRKADVTRCPILAPLISIIGRIVLRI